MPHWLFSVCILAAIVVGRLRRPMPAVDWLLPLQSAVSAAIFVPAMMTIRQPAHLESQAAVAVVLIDAATRRHAQAAIGQPAPP